MNSIMITLGHNSSALFYNGNSKPIGYEEERLNGVKSFSGFPKLALKTILDHIGDQNVDIIFISHWFDSFDLLDFPAKYFNHAYFNSFIKKFPGVIVSSLTRNFTHHDAHAYSSLAFAKDNDGLKPGDHFIVADGFGNKQEVFSVYEYVDYEDSLQLTERVVGYKYSLGLMYQYATSFCGMKENQDEYKFLGYETEIDEIFYNDEIDIINTYIVQSINHFKEGFENKTDYIPGSEHINFNELLSTKSYWHSEFAHMVYELGITNNHHIRVAVAFAIQQTIENVLLHVISTRNIRRVHLSGGCFYNVKLNNIIAKNVDALSVMPLAGDQGAAIGMYVRDHYSFKFYDLCYGKRAFLSDPIRDTNVILCTSRDEYVQSVSNLLNEDKIVNVVTDSMEFGPRALCNTSTLAAPNKANVDYINELNGRNTIMPMAPVILQSAIRALFGSEHTVAKTIGSNKYMIITHDFDGEVADSEHYRGIMHKYPFTNRYSGRPQVIYRDENRTIRDILIKVKYLALINTSFNVHGSPISYSMGNAYTNFLAQRAHDTDNRTYLVIYNGKD